MTIPRKKGSRRRKPRAAAPAADTVAAKSDDAALACKFDEAMPPRRNTPVQSPQEVEDALPPAFEESPLDR